MASNECIPFYDDGDNITGFCEAAVTGKTFVALGTSRTDPAFDPTQTALDTDRGCVHIKPPTAAQTAPIFGVAAYDGPANGFVDVIRGTKMVVPVTAALAFTTGEEVGVGPNGQATPWTAGVKCGYVVGDCAGGEDAQVSLY
jgi:hypothetical protein